VYRGGRGGINSLFSRQKAACACSKSEFGHIRSDISLSYIYIYSLSEARDPVMGTQREGDARINSLF
jgi:hypothetical protein